MPSNLRLIRIPRVRRDRAAGAAAQQWTRCRDSQSGALIEEQETERKQIAETLHGVFAQALATLIMEVDLLSPMLDAVLEPARGRLRAIRSRLDALSRETGDLAHRIRPVILDDGLEAALDAECHEFSIREGIPVRFVARGPGARLDGNTEATLFRVARKCLRVLAGPPRASRATMTLSGNNRRVRILLRYGGGRTESAQSCGGTVGLASVERRMEAIGGVFHVKSGGGCTQFVAEVTGGTGSLE